MAILPALIIVELPLLLPKSENAIPFRYENVNSSCFPLWKTVKIEGEITFLLCSNEFILCISWCNFNYFLNHKTKSNRVRVYATRLHHFGSFDWRPQHVPEGLNLWQKVSTYHNYGQCCVISLYRWFSVLHSSEAVVVSRFITCWHEGRGSSLSLGSCNCKTSMCSC
jgi:hypothetical protein